MIIFTPEGYDIDPQYLGVQCIAKLYYRDKSKAKKIGKAQCLFLYYMYHPKSLFKATRLATRDMAVIEATFPKDFNPKDWDQDKRVKDEDYMWAEKWYREEHLGKTPLHDSVTALQEAIYQVNDVLKDPVKTIYEKSKARAELDVLPQSLVKMQKQAEENEVVTAKFKGDRDIKHSEMRENIGKVRKIKGVKYKGATAPEHDPEADLHLNQGVSV